MSLWGVDELLIKSFFTGIRKSRIDTLSIRLFLIFSQRRALKRTRVIDLWRLDDR